MTRIEQEELFGQQLLSELEQSERDEILDEMDQYFDYSCSAIENEGNLL